MYRFYVQGEKDEKGGGGTSACYYASMTEQTNAFRSTNKSHGKLTDVNLVLHQCCNNGQCPLIITFYFNVISWTHACRFNENCYCAYSKKQAR